MQSGLTRPTKVLYLMNNEFIQKQLYSSLLNILHDRKFYHSSMVDHKYSNFTDLGKDVLVEWIEMLAPKLLKSEQEVLDEKVKDKVWNTLKEQNNEQSRQKG